MADLSSGQVRAIARLARLQVDAGDVEEMGRQLGRILDAFSVLAAVDVEAVTPTAHILELTGGGRPDQPTPCLPREAALDQAPDGADGLFRVPRVLT
jgi:aspartyl-tRNA(Asn)/glutamyl-tRNA(Gln) amidotransferase subunit C